MPTIAVSGGFDPIHNGHLDYIEEASRHGNVHVYLNSDAWLMRKKGYVFMPFGQRARLLWALKGVTLVIPAEDDDGTVCKTIQKFRPDFFAKGGDRNKDNTPEAELCGHLGIEILWNCGGDKIESSSELVKRASKMAKTQTLVEGEWGK